MTSRYVNWLVGLNEAINRHIRETLQPYTLVLVRRMEVVCGGECFTPAGIPCRRELWTLGVEKSLKRTKTRPFRWPWEGCRKHRVAGAVEIRHSKPPGVAVHTRWCISAFHQTYLVINYSIIEVTLFCSDCSNYRYKSLYIYRCTWTT
jgi:hypothetical protein